MSVSIDDERRFINDQGFPPKYSNEEIAKAVMDAERHLSETRGINDTTVEGERLIRLQAAVYLFESPRDVHSGAGAIKKIKDGNGYIEFSDKGVSKLVQYKELLKEGLLLQEDPMEVEYENY